MAVQADWIRIELNAGLMQTAEQWGSTRNLRRWRDGARTSMSFEEKRLNHIRGVRGELAARLYFDQPITRDDDWIDDIRRGWDVAGYGIRCMAEPWYGLTLSPGEHGRFLLVLDHDHPVMWLVGWIDATDGYEVAAVRNNGDNKYGSRYWVVWQKDLHPLPEQNGCTRRAAARWLVDPQTPFWCESCGGMHPIVEHRHCREVSSTR